MDDLICYFFGAGTVVLAWLVIQIAIELDKNSKEK